MYNIMDSAATSYDHINVWHSVIVMLTHTVRTLGNVDHSGGASLGFATPPTQEFLLE